jgi:hypothetical protein
LKATAKRKFDEAILNNSKQTPPSNSNLKTDLPPTTPTQSPNGILVPNAQYLFTQPFGPTKTRDHYFYHLRLNLAQEVDVDYDIEKKYIKLEIYNLTSLTNHELQKTELYRQYPHIQVTEKEEKLINILIISIPEDAALESLERRDIDTKAGYLLEIILERKKEVDKSKLKGKRFKHLKANFTSEEKLDHQSGFIENENSMILENGNDNDDDDEDEDGEEDDDTSEKDDATG